MRLSTKGEYASRAMVELAARYGHGPVPIKIIALSQAIPQQFLEQILLLLKRSSLKSPLIPVATAIKS